MIEAYTLDALPQPLMESLKHCEWDAARFLCRLIGEGRGEAVLGAGTRLLVAQKEERPLGFLTLAPKDCIDDESLSPWIGFVYVWPEYRGQGLCGKLLGAAINRAMSQGCQQVYLATDHVGLYERYGFTYVESRRDVWGEESRVYRYNLRLPGKEITLAPYTLARCQAFWQDYVADPAMMDGTYHYDWAWTAAYYQRKAMDPARRFFAICHEVKPVGEIQLKRIDWHNRCATLSIHFARDEYKNRGWGTEAETLLIRWAFNTLGLEKIYADAVHRNTRSQHVLEKLGFGFTHADEALRYYELKNTLTSFL